MAEVATLVIEVASGAIDKASSQLRQLSTSAHEAETATSKLSSTFSGLATILAGMEFYELAKNTVMLAARYETLGATLGVMGNNAGYSRQAMYEFQQSLEETGISAIKARSSLQIMAAAQLKLEEASKLGRVAQDAATLAGINSSDAFNNLVRGITTGEVRIIRHMGIMANFTTALKNYADANHTTVDKLNSRQRAEARLINVLEEGAKRQGVYEAAMTTAGKQMLSMQRYTENLQVQVGELFNPSTNAAVFGLVLALKEVNRELTEWKNSGEMAVMASNLRANMEQLVAVIRGVSVFVWEHIGVIRAMGAAYVAVKLGQVVSGWTQAATLWYASINQGAAIRQNEIRDVIAKLNLQRASRAETLLEVQAEIAKHKGKFVTASLLGKEMVAQRLLNESVREGIVAQRALAAATAGTSATSSIFSSIVAGLGGPVGIAVIAISALIYSLTQLKDEMMEASKEVKRSMEDRLEEMSDKIAQNVRVMQLIRQGVAKDKAAKQAEDEAAAARDLNQNLKTRTKLETELLDVTAKLAERKRLYARPDGTSDALTQTYEQRKRIITKEIADLDSQRESYKMLATTLKETTDQKDKYMKSSEKPSALLDEEPQKLRAVHKEINKLQEERNNLLFAAKGYSKEELERYKAEQDLAQKIADVWANTKPDGKSPAKYGKDVAEALQKLHTEIYAAKVALSDYNEEQRRATEAGKISKSAVEANAGTLEQLEKELEKLNKTERDRYVQETMALSLYGMTDEAIKERIRLYDELTGKITSQTTANEEQKRLDQMATGLNKRHTEDSDRLADLNKLKAQGKLIEGVYEKAWFEVMMKGDSAMAYIVQSTSKLFDTLGGYLGDLFTGTSTSFRDMISKMMADLARFFASEAMKKLLMIGVSMFTGGSGGGSDWAGTSSTSGKASGGPVTGGVAYTVGEQGPELFVPGASGTIIPNNMMNAGSSGGDTTISITVNMEEGKKDNVTSSSDTGRQTGLLIASAVRAVIIDEKRPGGLLFAGA